MIARSLLFSFVVTTGVFMSGQNNNWVQSTIDELRWSDQYRKDVIDEWYETLPVVAWDHDGASIVVRFGRNAMSKPAGTAMPVRVAQSPHLQCAISFPAATMRWSPIADNAFSVQGGDLNNMPKRGNVMELRRSYYRALSLVLDSQSLLKKPGQISSVDCSLVANAQKLLLEAADPNLLWYYRQASAPVHSWLAAHCPPAS